ncbi:class I SAM-dependent methyltransferase [Lysobacter sp. HA18]
MSTARLLAALPPGKVLDVGCAGRWAAHKLPPSCMYVGLDYPASGGIDYGSTPDVFGDVMRLPFADGSFDTVLLLEVLEHVSKPDVALEDIRRVLRPGGRLVFSMPFIYPVHDAPFDYQRYTEHGLARSLARAGFEKPDIRPVLGAIESAGLMIALALAGSAITALQTMGTGLLALPLIAFLVPVTNVVAWSLARILPNWSALTVGYEGMAVRE